MRRHLLLTSAVNVGGIANCQHSDPLVRARETVGALEKWVSRRHIDEITIVDNSGYDFSKEVDRVSSASRAGLKVRSLAYEGQDFDRSLGKGFGEQSAIRHFFENSDISPGDLVIKCNARIYVSNFNKLWPISLDEVDIICAWQLGLRQVNSRLFAAKAFVWEEYFFQRCHKISDAMGQHFEDWMAKSVHAALADGHRSELFLTYPRFRGVSGTVGVDLSGNYLVMRNWLLHRLKRFVLRR